MLQDEARDYEIKGCGRQRPAREICVVAQRHELIQIWIANCRRVRVYAYEMLVMIVVPGGTDIYFLSHIRRPISECPVLTAPKSFRKILRARDRRHLDTNENAEC